MCLIKLPANIGVGFLRCETRITLGNTTERLIEASERFRVLKHTIIIFQVDLCP